MEVYKLNNVDPRDMGDVLMKVQRSFNIELDNEGLKEVHTFGHLCDLIIDKINLNQSDICSTQHAFYKLRDAIAHRAGMDKCAIKPQAKLSEIIPSDNRLEFISEVENELGYEFNLLQPRKWVTSVFVLLLAASILGCFYNWQLGITGILISAISLKFSGKFGKEMHLKTVGDLANKISKESYLRCKHNRCTINKNEVEQRVRELFTNELKPEPIAIRRNTHFN
jgi:acyl carrier protein